ncbi:MAG: hypothetical protein ABI981_06465 [Betaproteobacteria bacterium]
MRIVHRQGGWVGLIVLLVALVIVAVLSQTLLKRMGLLQDDRTTVRAGTRAPGAIAPGPIDATGAAPAPINALERARGLESSVQQQSQDMTQRIDAQTK